MERGRARRQLHGYISAEAFRAWHGFARAFGINVTALMEALADPLVTGAKQPEAQLPALLKAAVREARQIAAARSSRSLG